jgi:predicted anti-sigma-YlaC factor YlaD
MTCPHYYTWLQSQLDGEGHGDPLMAERHLHDCPSCRALDNAAQRLREGLLATTPPYPPADLALRIAGRVVADCRRARRRRVAAWTALAAGLLLTIGTAIAWPRFFPAKPENPGNAEVILSRSEPPTPPLRLRESMAEAGYAVASLTSQAADETMGHTRRLIPSVTGGSLDMAAAAPALESPKQSLREAGLGVSEGLEPVADSARRAVGLFLRELPIDKGERSSH